MNSQLNWHAFNRFLLDFREQPTLFSASRSIIGNFSTQLKVGFTISFHIATLHRLRESEFSTNYCEKDRDAHTISMTTTSSISTLSMSHEIIKCSISNQAKESRRQYHHHRRQVSSNAPSGGEDEATIHHDLIPFIPNLSSCDKEEDEERIWIRRNIPSTKLSSSSFRFYFIATITLALCLLPTIASQNISSYHHHHHRHYQLPTL